MYRKPETIKCSKCSKCGYDSGIPKNGPFMRVIPEEGIKCPCGRVLVQPPSRVELSCACSYQESYIS